MPYTQRPNGQGSSSSKPLTPHPSLPVNPMTYQPPPPQQPPAIPPNPISMAVNYQPPVMPYAYAPTGMPIPAYPAMYGQSQPGMMMMPPSQGHYNPTMALRQSLFQTPVYGYIPTQTVEGYSYSSTYLQQQQQQQQTAPQVTKVQPPQQTTAGPSVEPSSRPAKRARPNIPTTSSSTNSNHPTASTTDSTTPPAPTSYLPTRTKLPLKKGQTEESSQGHWRNCSEPGCHYVGPDREVKVHEEDRHLIVRGAKRGMGGVGKDGGKEADDDRDEEEEERARRAVSGPKMPIPGTSITLETPEDIARWIAERKARWPTSERVATKEKERQEKIDRGEIDPHERSGRGGGRGRGRGGDRERGRGRGRERGGGGGGGGGRGRSGSAAVRGRDNGYGTRGGEGADASVKPERIDKDKDQLEINSDGSTSSSSSSEDDDTSSSSSSAPETNNVHTRVPALPTTLEPPHATPSTARPTDDPPKTAKKETCRAFVRTGKCKFGSRCRYDHPNKVGGEKNKVRGDKGDDHDKRGEPRDVSSAIGQLSNPFARPSLLDAMLKDPLQQTLLTLTETIDFIVDNDFFDGVELVPGQAEEELERRRKVDARIEVVGGEEEEEEMKEAVMS